MSNKIRTFCKDTKSFIIDRLHVPDNNCNKFPLPFVMIAMISLLYWLLLILVHLIVYWL